MIVVAHDIGCIRLILPNPQGPVTLFPFEKTCAATIDRSLIDPETIDRTKVAEVSRLAVVSAYRRRKGETDSAGTISKDDFGSPERPRFPYVPVGLYVGMICQAQRQGIDTLFALTEPRPARTAPVAARRAHQAHWRTRGAPGQARAVDDVGSGYRRRVRAVRAAVVRAHSRRGGGGIRRRAARRQGRTRLPPHREAPAAT